MAKVELRAQLIILASFPVLLVSSVFLFSTKENVLQTVIQTLLFLLGLPFFLRFLLRQHDRDLKFEFFTGNFRSIVLPALIISFLLQFEWNAATVAQETDPPLPRVEITWTTDASNSTKATLLEGKLLTHTESFWYVLNKGGQDAGLTAIPDDKVQHVRIGPHAKEHGE
jgi:hypothetical protein